MYWSSARYTFPLPEGHRFPIAKYELLRQRVVAAGLGPVREPERIDRPSLLLVHTERYMDAFTKGTLSADELRRLGFPWTPELVERSYRACGGTLAAARFALDEGVAMNLAGGTHHAFPDRGEGFCVFNDVAIAIRTLQAEGRIERAAIVDLDVHQGNGTNAIFADDDRVFTFSMHGRRNYPFTKVKGSLDVELEDGCADDEYLSLLAEALPRVLSDARPDLAVYLAGADAHEEDRLGRLRLTTAGLARRDVMVLGYGTHIETTVAIHAETARLVAVFAELGTNRR
jgi:acetoin utilization deacetylase AcuC-like enzyme